MNRYAETRDALRLLDDFMVRASEERCGRKVRQLLKLGHAVYLALDEKLSNGR